MCKPWRIYRMTWNDGVNDTFCEISRSTDGKHRMGPSTWIALIADLHVAMFGTESTETLVEFPTVWFPKSSKNHPKSSKNLYISLWEMWSNPPWKAVPMSGSPDAPGGERLGCAVTWRPVSFSSGQSSAPTMRRPMVWDVWVTRVEAAAVPTIFPNPEAAAFNSFPSPFFEDPSWVFGDGLKPRLNFLAGYLKTNEEINGANARLRILFHVQWTCQAVLLIRWTFAPSD